MKILGPWKIHFNIDGIKVEMRRENLETDRAGLIAQRNATGTFGHNARKFPPDMAFSSFEEAINDGEKLLLSDGWILCETEEEFEKYQLL